MSDINPALLSLLNVKYLVIPTVGLYFNTAPADSDMSHGTGTPGSTPDLGEVVNIDGISFGLIRNPLVPLPRHFLVDKVTGVQETPTMQGAALEAPAQFAGERPDGAGASTLIREKIDRLTSHSLAENFRGAQIFDPSGSLDIAYQGDVIDIRVPASDRDRFLVINERYHPDWHARADTQEVPIFPTNAVMMGIQIPATLDRIQLRFEPFSSSRAAHMLMLLALVVFLAAIGMFWLGSRRLHRPST
jgi:hypothetical protein